MTFATPVLRYRLFKSRFVKWSELYHPTSNPMNLEKGASDDDELRIRRSRKVLNTEDGADILSQHCIIDPYLILKAPMTKLNFRWISSDHLLKATRIERLRTLRCVSAVIPISTGYVFGAGHRQDTPLSRCCPTLDRTSVH